MAVMLGTASAQVTLDIGQFMANANKAEGAMNQLAGAGTGTGQTSMMQRLTQGALGLGTALIAPMALGLKTAIDLEQQMANVDAALGDISDNDLSALADQFNEIAVASQFSAVEIGAVGEELAKAGVAREDLANTTQAVVDLSQATGSNLSSSLTAVTTATAIWAEGLVDAEDVITDVTTVADGLTTVTNSTRASIDDVNAGMRSLAPAAARAGLSYTEAAAAIGFFVDMGLTGADAGVSLTRGMTELADPTSEATAVLQELGIAAYDTQGNFVGFPALFDQLQVATAGLTDQEKELVLTSIFGAEAIDVMGIAALTGGDRLRELEAAALESGTAAEQSAIRMDTLSAQLGTLAEGVNTFLGSLVSGLLPGMRIFVDFANTVVDALMQIPGPIKTVIGALAGLLAGFAAITRSIQTFRALNGIMNAFAGNSAVAAVAGRGFLRTMLRFVPGLALVSAGLLLWQTNLFGVQDKLRSLGSGIKDFANSFINSYRALTDDVVEMTSWTTTNITEGMAVIPALFIAFGNALAGVGEGIPILEDIGTAAMEFGETIIYLTEAFDHFRDLGLDPVQAGLRAIGIMFPSLSDAAGALQIVVGQVNEAFQSISAGDYGAAFDSIVAAVNTAFDALSGFVGTIWDWTIDVAVPTVTGWLSTAAGNMWEALKAAAGFVWDGAEDLGAWVLSTAAPTVVGWIRAAGTNVWSALKAAAGFAWDGVEDLGAWTLNTAAPTVIGWIRAASTNVWNAIKSAVGWSGEVLGELGTWTLNTAAPTVIGWIRAAGTNAWQAIKMASGWAGDVLGEMGAWTLNTVAPTVTGWLTTAATWISEQITLQDFGIVGNTVGAKVMSAISLAFSAGGAVGSATGGVFNIGASVLNWINRQIESQLGGGFEAVGHRIGQALAAAIAGAIAGGGVLDIVGKSFSIGLIGAISDEMGSSGFSDAFWRLFSNIGQAGSEVFEGVAEGFISSFTNAIAPGGKLTLPGGFTISVPNIEFGGSLATAFKHAFLEAAIPTSQMDLGSVKGVVEDIDLGDLQAAFLEAFINAAVPGGSIVIPALDVEIGDLNPFSGDSSGMPPFTPGMGPPPQYRDQQTRPGDDIPVEPVPVPEATTASWFAYAGALDLASGAAGRASIAIGGIFGGGGVGASGGGAGPDASGILGSITAVQEALTGLAATALTAGTALGQQFAAGIANGMATAHSVAITMVANIVAGLAALGGAFQGTGRNLGLQLAAGLSNSLIVARTMAITTVANIVAGISALGGAFQGAGRNLGQQFTAGLANGLAPARSVAVSMVASILSGVAGLAGAFRGTGFAIGSALGEGIAAGLNSQIGAVQAAASRLVSAAAGAAAATGLIKSPSQLMAREVGEPLALGVAAGMISGLPAIYSAASRMIPNIPVGTYRANGAPYGGMTSTHTTIVHAPVNIAGNVTTENAIIEHAAESISESIVRRSQQRAVAMGMAT